VRLTPRLLLGTLSIVGSLAAFVAFTVDSRLRRELADENTRRLARDAQFIGALWARSTDPDALADSAAASLDVAVTLVDRLGQPMGDSRLAQGQLAAAENLANRPEVAAALVGRTGSAARPDPSTGAPHWYVAVQSGPGVVRVDVDASLLDTAFADARRDVRLAALVAVLGAVGLALVFSGTIVGPITQLRDVARALASGDLSRRPALAAPGEVGELANAVHRLAEQLGSRLSALSAEETLLAATLESLSEGVIAVDARQQVVRVNETARRLLGVRDAVPFAADRLPRERFLRDALAAALDGTATDTLETQIGDRTVALTAKPLGAGGAVVAMYDLTPVRRLETVRRDFVANVSHELKTPLTVIGGFAETLLDDALPAPNRRQFAEAVRSNAVRMQRIVDDLLDLSRIESGGWIPAPGWTDIAATAGDALLSAQAVAGPKGLTLSCTPSDGATHAWVDPTALRQIVGNLVDNAVRHTAHGGVTVSAERESDGVIIRVRDSGVGIPPEHLARVFERFYRVDPARSRDAGGTGLGLSIVKHLTEAHGGRVWAESAPGEGTTIALTLPDPVGPAVTEP
jgi:two-component system, OmpR family, phosphate regulon sensor histidine kinase PhoR